MNKGIVLGIVILVIGMSFTGSTYSLSMSKSQTFPFDGNILYVGGSGEGNYTNIQDAVDNASDGDTVFVYNGIYAADIIVDKQIFLIGENQDSTVIEMGDNGISIYADGVTVEKFTIEKCGGFWHRSGIYIGSNHNLISNVTIANNEILNGIFIEDSNDNTVSNNIIADNLYFGIRLEYSSRNIIMKNLVSNVVTNGIILTGSSDNEIFLNTIKQCTWGGITLNSYCFDNNIYHNGFINNSYYNGFDEGSNIWDDGYPSGGNYWDDYTGEDNDGDGIGDTPYSITGGDNMDRYPLMYPTVNFPPDKPIIDGPRSGKPGIEYEYIFNSTDLNDDAVMYIVDWGDGITEWTEYSDSGEEIMLKHKWSEKGDYTIKAKAIDIHGAESDWSEFEVTMPRDKATNNQLLLLRLLERFPLLQKLLLFSL